MKHTTYISILTCSLILAGCSSPVKTNTNTATDKTFTIYAYDSLTAEYGLLPQILEQFEQDNVTAVNIVSFNDTGSMLSQLLLEQNAPQADIVMGLDNIDYAQAVKHNLFTSYEPTRSAEIASDVWFDDQFLMTPFDYGYVGFVYDSTQLNFPKPISLADLASDTYAEQIIIEQAGVSSPGTQLLLWTNAALGEAGADTFWLSMADNAFQVTPDWSTAYYTLFLEGEAPIVLSYLTSPAYHLDQEQTDQYKAIPIKEGYIRQVEGIAVVNGSDQPELAGKFIDYVLTDEIQNAVTTTQWMFPVLGNPETWPAAYNKIIVPTDKQIISVPAEDIETNLETWLQEYNRTFGIE